MAHNKSNEELSQEIKELREELRQMREIVSAIIGLMVEAEEDEEEEYFGIPGNIDTPRMNN